MLSLYAGMAATIATSMVNPSSEGSDINHTELKMGHETAPVQKYTNTIVNFRESDSIDSEVIAVLDPNTIVQMYSTNGEWSSITYGENSGYIYSIYLSDEEVPLKVNRWDIELSNDERKLLAQILWVEARGETTCGQQAVIEVIFNRIISKKFPDTLYEVVSQTGQFSSWDDHYGVEPYDKQYEVIEDVVGGNTNLLCLDTIYFSTFPRNNNIDAVIGNHYFCKED